MYDSSETKQPEQPATNMALPSSATTADKIRELVRQRCDDTKSDPSKETTQQTASSSPASSKKERKLQHHESPPQLVAAFQLMREFSPCVDKTKSEDAAPTTPSVIPLCRPLVEISGTINPVDEEDEEELKGAIRKSSYCFARGEDDESQCAYHQRRRRRSSTTTNSSSSSSSIRFYRQYRRRSSNSNSSTRSRRRNFSTGSAITTTFLRCSDLSLLGNSSNHLLGHSNHSAHITHEEEQEEQQHIQQQEEHDEGEEPASAPRPPMLRFGQSDQMSSLAFNQWLQQQQQKQQSDTATTTTTSPKATPTKTMTKSASRRRSSRGVQDIVLDFSNLLVAPPASTPSPTLPLAKKEIVLDFGQAPVIPPSPTVNLRKKTNSKAPARSRSAVLRKFKRDQVATLHLATFAATAIKPGKRITL